MMTQSVADWVEGYRVKADALERAALDLSQHCFTVPPIQTEADTEAVINFRRWLFNLPPVPAGPAEQEAAGQLAHQALVQKLAPLLGAFVTLALRLEVMLQSTADAGDCGLLSAAAFGKDELRVEGGSYVCYAGQHGCALPAGHALRKLIPAEHFPPSGRVPVAEAVVKRSLTGQPPRPYFPSWIRALGIRKLCRELADEQAELRERVEQETRAVNALHQAELLRRKRASLEAQLAELAGHEVANHA